MVPTELLMREHEVIAKGLAVLRGLAALLEHGEPAPPGSALRLLDFFAAFADRHHHGKEEQLLFPALVAAGLPPEDGPIGVMLHEHELGRALLARLREAAPGLDAPGRARGEFIEAAHQYCALLADHIHKENNILFRLADQLLSREQSRELGESFERIEQEAAAGKRNEPHLRAVDELWLVVVGPSEILEGSPRELTTARR